MVKPLSLFAWFLVAVFCATAAFPPAFWVAVFVHAVRAARFLGRWPSYDQPDPKAFPAYLQAETMEAVIGAVVLVLLVAVAMIALKRFRWFGRLFSSAALVPLVWAAFYMLARIDPLGILEWYFD